MTEPEPLQPVDRTYVRFRGRKFSSFSGCDYFRMASHPAVLKAVADGLKKYGLSVSASRVTTGNHSLYSKLEGELAKFFGAESALVVPTGYLAGQAVAQALAGNYSHALIDENSHPASQDVVARMDCPVLKFKHRDPADFVERVKRCGPGARIAVFTDGMFAYDGAVVPLGEYLAVLPKDGVIVVDDAHAAGILGKTGKGSVEVAGVSRKQIIQCVTLSKAFGAYGGAVLCSGTLRKQIVTRSRMFIGSTPFPLPLANAALTATKLLRDSRFRTRLNANAAFVKRELVKAGFEMLDTPGPIVPVVAENARQTRVLRRMLLAAEIYPPLLRYPGSPEGYFRFVISSEHSRDQLATLAGVLVAFKKK
ncbi:MAG TPA: pyridoxal phosphate-dependent aminotransferase family protein [Candidatus Paceibacterota bacterium]|nr:pyridoxal phosphate-dependent aminotransferase family protein [Candidatus Paceibacterota bacterium]